MGSTAEALAIAVSHHQAGRREQAERLYREILRDDPQHPDALHLLGVIGNETGNQAMAVEYISQAIGLRPDIAEFHNNLGNALQGQGRLDDAVASYQQALELKPQYETAHNNLGNALKAQGKLDEAIEHYRRALDLQPQYPGALCNLGSALQTKGQLGEAVTAYRQALVLNPGFSEVYNNLGNALHLQGKDEEAEDACRQAIRLNPNYAEAHSNFGAMLQAAGRFDQAIESLQQAICINPDHAESYANLGSVSATLGKSEEAVRQFRKALELNPCLASPYHELAKLCGQEACEISEAEIAAMHELLRDARISMDDASLLHFALAHLLDQQGNCDEAFPHYEQGNELRKQYLKQRNIQIDHEKYLGLIDEMVAVFDRDYFRRVASYGVDNHQTVIRELVTFCGLPWDSRCLTFYETDRAVRSPTKFEVRKPIYRSAVGRWKKYERYLQPLIEALESSVGEIGPDTS